MNNLHKIFKELQKISYDDFDLLRDAWQEHYNVKIMCQNMGIKYSDKYLINCLKKRINNRLTPAIPINGLRTNNRDKKIEQIILGDNLDIIEEAANKKGLI